MKKYLLLCLLILSGCCAGKKPMDCCHKLVHGKTVAVHFAFNSAEIAGKNQEILNHLAEKLKKCPQVNVSIVGYTDNTGSEAYNLKLGQIRADAVQSYLQGRGVQNAYVSVESMGDRNPVASNDCPDKRALNRRATIKISL